MRVRTAVIPVAGLGTRFLPATNLSQNAPRIGSPLCGLHCTALQTQVLNESYL